MELQVELLVRFFFCEYIASLAMLVAILATVRLQTVKITLYSDDDYAN